jgi:hypothetical protein
MEEKEGGAIACVAMPSSRIRHFPRIVFCSHVDYRILSGAGSRALPTLTLYAR